MVFPSRVEFVEEVQDYLGGFRIEVPCGFVCEDVARMVGESAGDSGALLLTAGELCGGDESVGGRDLLERRVVYSGRGLLRRFALIGKQAPQRFQQPSAGG